MEIRMHPRDEGDAFRMVRCVEKFERDRPEAIGITNAIVYGGDDGWHCYVYRTKTAIIARRT